MMKWSVWLALLCAAFLVFACGGDGDESDVTEPDTPPPVVAAQPDTAQPGEQTAMPAAPAAGESQGALSGMWGDLAGLTSYRSRTVLTDLETGEVEETTAEAVMDPFALRMEMEMGQMILTGEGVWMEIPGMGWYQMGFTPGEMGMSREELMALEWGDVDELPDIPAWPSGILFMPDQSAIPLVEGGLTPAGQSSVNGIPCRLYDIATDYSYTLSDELFGEETDERVQATGVICVADQADLPALIVQASIEQSERYTIAGQEMSWQQRVEYEITEINIPITIEPPADAMRMDGE
jgi:hypothetical protein